MARGIMRSELFNRIVESIKPHLDLVRVVVLYHGGEPLLNRHFGQMVRELKSLNIPFVKTVSNGMLLSDQACADIVNYRLDAIEFSLDGESAEENNFIRRNAQFEHIKTNIFKLIEYKQRIQSALPRIGISTTQFVRPDNYTRDQQAAAPDYLLQAFGEQDVAFKPTFAMRWPHMIVMDDIYDQFNDPFDQDDKNSCDHVDSTITIHWNGDVVPCCYDLTSQLVMGNVLEKDIADIWNN